MIQKTDKKAQTRKKMLDAAGCKFRKHGYSGVGVDGLAKAANVTSGAFYAHFGSKDAAFDAVLATGLNDVIETIPIYQSKHGTDWVNAFVDYYMGKPHRSKLSCACAMATLTPEVVRSDSKVRQAFEKKMTLIAELVASGLAGTSDRDRLARAWALLSILVGGLNVSLAVKNLKLADEIAIAVKTAAINIAGSTQQTK